MTVSSTRFVRDAEIFSAVFEDLLPSAENYVWIATADIKDLHVPRGSRRKFDSFLALLADLVNSGIEIRLIHAKEPGPRFREDFDRFPELIQSDRFERVLCPRNHMKSVVVDGERAFLGSANLTGAGMGAKSDHRRNFEIGVLTSAPDLVDGVMETYDELFRGEHCPSCERRDVCPDPIV